MEPQFASLASYLYAPPTFPDYLQALFLTPVPWRTAYLTTSNVFLSTTRATRCSTSPTINSTPTEHILPPSCPLFFQLYPSTGRIATERRYQCQWDTGASIIGSWEGRFRLVGVAWHRRLSQELLHSQIVRSMRSAILTCEKSRQRYTGLTGIEG